jgi:hypothetical protein
MNQFVRVSAREPSETPMLGVVASKPDLIALENGTEVVDPI